MKWLAYDLEACFLQKGKSRSHTKILEIALYNKDVKFQRLVNPLSSYDTGSAVIDNLTSQGQHAENTINFWTKLLIEKKAFPSNTKRKSTEEKADAISTLLKRSDVARKFEDSSLMMAALERCDDDEEKAMDDLRQGEESFNQLFYTPKEALEDAIQTGKSYIWCAHNGKSFDEKILRGHEHDWDDIEFYDSLPLLKHRLPNLDSYSQPRVYHHLFKSKYFAHHALDDSQALYKIIDKVLAGDDIEEAMHQCVKHKNKVKNKKHAHSNLYEMRGIGEKSVEKLFAKKIETKEQLIAEVEKLSYDQWCKSYNFVHNYKKLYTNLRPYASSAVV